MRARESVGCQINAEWGFETRREQPRDLLSQVQVEAEAVEPVDVCAANGRVRNHLEHL
jgi:hypothetical protein